MALAKIKRNNKALIKIIVGVLLVTNTILLSCKVKLDNKVSENQETIQSLENQIASLKETEERLQEDLSYEINSESDIRKIRKNLIEAIKSTVDERDRTIKDTDIIRALKSTENRLMDEYIRIASLVLATMETESNFKYLTNENKNGTVDHGIMQVNDVAIPHLKEALGEFIDPVNNKDHNVEGGSYQIYDCYLKAKEKHPEDVIWWTYAYYNRGQYFENTDAWRNPSNPSYKAVHNQANVRSEKFKECFNAYYEALVALI